MEQREKLIELLANPNKTDECLGGWCSNECKYFDSGDYCKTEMLSDHLLANGVVVLPCKVGDAVYVPYPALNSVEQFPIESIEIYKSGTVFCTDTCNVEFNASDFGKTVFLTREEAEKALAK